MFGFWDPQPLKISSDLPQGDYGNFLELHIFVIYFLADFPNICSLKIIF